MFNSLYIHVPFCNGKCAYCAFYSIRPNAELRAQYLKHLKCELVENAPQCGVLNSIFVGGGTPSVLDLREWEEIFNVIHGNFTLAEKHEWSVEANPESLSPELIRLWAANGVNRISIGIQAFQENLRKTIGRQGTLEKLPQLVECIHSCIPELNFDLIYNSPCQTLEDWRSSLKHALQFSPTHLSAYALTLEENTRLAKNMASLEDVDFTAFWDMADDVLADANIKRYEISNFAIPGHECRHNLEIWKGATYLGCGPAATSFDGTDRFTNPPSLSRWLQKEPPETDSLPEERRACEILAFGMRTVSGWNWNDFKSRTGFDAEQLRGAQLAKLCRLGLLEQTCDGTRPTRQGLLFNDDVVMELL